MRSEQLGGAITGPRTGRMRNRRGRGPRGPVALPGPLSAGGVPVQRSPRQRFDQLVHELVDALAPHFAQEATEVHVVVEDLPLLPPAWDEPVPLGTVDRDNLPHRVVVYRLPIEQRCKSAAELRELTWSTVLDGLADVWNVAPERLDPREPD